MKVLFLTILFGLFGIMSAHAENERSKFAKIYAPPDEYCKEDCYYLAPSPNDFRNISFVNDFNAQQSQNLELAEGWANNIQIVLMSKKEGRYEYKIRFAKFHRLNKKYYVAKQTPYVLSVYQVGNTELINRHLGMSDENGYSQSIILDAPLKEVHELQEKDLFIDMREFINVIDSYGSTNTAFDDKSIGTFQVGPVYEPHTHINIPMVYRFTCPNRSHEFYYFVTDNSGYTPYFRYKGCVYIPFMVLDKKYGQFPYHHTYRR